MNKIIARVVCCRIWPIVVGLGLGKCGLCGQRPTRACWYCKDPIGGGPGGYFSLKDQHEVCSGLSPTSFHEWVPS